MSTYYKTEPKAIPFERIKAAVDQAYDMEMFTNKRGGATITAVEYKNSNGRDLNWLHLEIDEETQTVTCCFRNGTSDASDILEYLEFALECRFVSEYEPEYWGAKDWLDIGKDEHLESVSSGELSFGN